MKVNGFVGGGGFCYGELVSLFDLDVVVVRGLMLVSIFYC